MSDIIGKIRDYLNECPLLKNGVVGVDYIGVQMGYSVDPLPCDPVIQTYIDGGVKKQYQFAFTSKELYDEDKRITIDNSGFCQAFEEWLESQNMLGIMPELPGKKSAYKFETLNKGYLYDIDGNKARYRIECRLLYTQEV